MAQEIEDEVQKMVNVAVELKSGQNVQEEVQKNIILKGKQKKLEKDYDKAVAELKSLKFGENDTVMDNYIKERCQKFTNSNVPKKNEIIEDMQKMIIDLKNNKVEKVQQIVNGLKETAHLWTIGKKNKALRIEEAMCHVPLESRRNFLQKEKAKDADVMKVLEQLASQRSLIHNKQIHYLPNTKDIDEKKSASSFKEFKKEINQLKKQSDEEIDSNSNQPKR